MRVTHVFLAGVGGTGSILLEPLARMLAHHPASRDVRFIIADGDRFDDGNVARQMGCEPGARKCDVALARVQGILPASGIASYIDGSDVTDAIPMSSMMDTPDGTGAIVILAVDNHATRRSILEALRSHPTHSLLVLSPGNSETVSGQVKAWARVGFRDVTSYPLSVGPDGIALEPEMANPTDAIPREAADCITQAATPSGIQLIAANMLAASITLALVHRWLERDDGDVPYETGFTSTPIGFKVYSQ